MNYATGGPRALPRGRQTPRVLHRPRFDSEDDAHDAIDLLATCGQVLDPWQVLLTCVTLASLDGRLAASTVGALVARQNGKGGWLEAVAIWSLFEAYVTGRVFGPNADRSGGRNLTLWTAHETKTSDEAHLRVKSLIEASPDLAAQVVRWDGGPTGVHVIELRDGSRLAFIARSKSSGRGFSPRRVIFDEAQELSALKHRAMMYATSAQGADRQLIYTGTVPSEENSHEIWTGVRDLGRAGTSERAAWAEWTPKGSADPRATIDPSSWSVRAAANPALGSERLLHETIDAEWEAAQADLDGFLRERLSVWPTPLDDVSSVMPRWGSLRAPTPDAAPVALGVSVDPDGVWHSLGAVLGSERPHLGSVKRVKRDERAVFVDEVARLQAEHGCPVVLDGGSQAKVLVPDLEGAGVVVTVIGLPEYVQACDDLVQAVELGEVEHGDYTDLNAAVLAVSWRKVGDRRVFARRNGDISALEAVTVALIASREAATYDVLDSIL